MNVVLAGRLAAILSFLLISGLSTARVLPAGTNPTSVATGDFNGDGRVDIAASNFTSSDVYVYLNTGSGFFTAPDIYPVSGGGAYYVVSADFDNSGIPDLAACSWTEGSITVLLADGDGTFTDTGTTVTCSGSPVILRTGDWDNNGNMDLAAQCLSGGCRFYLGNGTGGFTQSQAYSTGYSGGYGFAVGRFNGDAFLDIAFQSGTSSISYAMGNGNGTFGVATARSVGGEPRYIQAVDIDEDSDIDLLVTCLTTNILVVLKNNGSGLLAVTGNTASGPSGMQPRTFIINDFNSDADLDVMVGPFNISDLSLLTGNGDGTFDAYTQVDIDTTNDEYRGLATADFNGDSVPDFATANYDTGDVIVMFGSGTGSFTVPVNLSRFAIE